MYSHLNGYILFFCPKFYTFWLKQIMYTFIYRLIKAISLHFKSITIIDTCSIIHWFRGQGHKIKQCDIDRWNIPKVACICWINLNHPKHGSYSKITIVTKAGTASDLTNRHLCRLYLLSPPPDRTPQPGYTSHLHVFCSKYPSLTNQFNCLTYLNDNFENISIYQMSYKYQVK